MQPQYLTLKGNYQYQCYSDMLKSKRAKLYEEQMGRCKYCGDHVAYEKSTIDHIRPLVKKGTSAYSNLAIACRACNNIKGSVYYEDEVLRIVTKYKNHSHRWRPKTRERVRKKVVFWKMLHDKGIIRFKNAPDWAIIVDPTVLPREEMVKAIAALKEAPRPNSRGYLDLIRTWGRRFAKIWE